MIRGFIGISYLACFEAGSAEVAQQAEPEGMTVAVDSIKLVKRSLVHRVSVVPEFDDDIGSRSNLTGRKSHATSVVWIVIGDESYHWHVLEPYEVVLQRIARASI